MTGVLFLPSSFFKMWDSPHRDISSGTSSAFATALEDVETGVTASQKIIKGSEGEVRKHHTSRLSSGKFAMLSYTSCRPPFPQPSTELWWSIRGEWDETPGFRAPLGPPTVAYARAKLAKYFSGSSAFFPVLPVWEALISEPQWKLTGLYGSMMPCQHFYNVFNQEIFISEIYCTKMYFWPPKIMFPSYCLLPEPFLNSILSFSGAIGFSVLCSMCLPR